MIARKQWTRPGIAGLSETLAFIALTTLAGWLPFELQRPLAALGPLAITNLEALLYTTALIWIASRALNRQWRWTAVHKAVLAWAMVLLLAALFAPTHRDQALKFTLRSWGGCALFFVAADLATTPRRVATVMLALSLGAVVSGLAALIEVGLPGAANALLAFKTQTSVIGSFVRASGTFQYANTGAMYWEAALPLLLALGVWRAKLHRDEQASRWLTLAAALVLLAALVLSASRAALIVVTLVLALLIGIAGRISPLLRTLAAASLAALFVLTLINLITSPLLALRLRTESDEAWYRADYRFPTASTLSVEAGQLITVDVALQNRGELTWSAFGEYPVFLSYHWYDPSRAQTIVFNGVRTPLLQDVSPGGQALLAARVLAPGQPGRYILRWDMVHEEVIWFSAKNAVTGDLPAEVTPARSGSLPPSLLEPFDLVRQASPARLSLWQAGLQMWLRSPLLGIGPDNFRHLYGPYLNLKPFDNRIHTNNLYVETLVNTGLTGLVAFSALLVALARAARRGWQAGRSIDARILRLGLILALLAFFIHGLFDYFFEFTSTYGLFWLLAGILTGLGNEELSV
ncbi:MAG TPA: O-antigen ligase family protein [Anaerolineae bacterium]|nr:O-antigen ligase family protein [Anaerolineae bacterium]